MAITRPWPSDDDCTPVRRWVDPRRAALHTRGRGTSSGSAVSARFGSARRHQAVAAATWADYAIITSCQGYTVMRTARCAILSILLLVAGVVSPPAAAFDGPPAPSAIVSIVLTSESPDSAAVDSGCLTLGELAAIFAGAVVVGAATQITLGGGPFTLLGIVGGAALGSLWYKHGI
jgi:hypothetical protein